MDSKLQEILLDYGLEGYGLYWYCLEMIVNKIDVDNLTFELEHDARIIARNTGSTPKKISEMMLRFVELDLFQNSQGRVTCLKLLQRLDKSMTSNAKFRTMMDKAKESHDSVMIEPDLVMQDKITLQEITQEEITLKESNKSPEVKKSKFCPVHFASSEYQGYELNLESWTEWCEFRKDGKKPIIKTTAVKQLKMLVNYSIDEQKEIIDKSIIGQYQGLFPLKNQTQPRYASNQTNSFDLDSDDFMNEQSFSEKYGVQK